MTRHRVLTAVSLLYAGLLLYLIPRVPLPLLNALLAVSVVPMVWLIWAFCRWSAHQHANRYARDVQKVHGTRPAPMPHRERVR
jgi:hypothetical protein